MRAKGLYVAAGVLICAVSHAGTLYRYVNPEGVVTYQSSPPPSSATHVRAVHFPDVSGGTSEHTRVHVAPVVLYEAPSCPPCTAAQRYLQARKVRFRAIDVANGKALAAMKKRTGATTIPTIIVGRRVLVGYVRSVVSAELTAAGYPRTPKGNS